MKTLYALSISGVSFIVIVFFLFGCSKNDELSRATAEKLIREKNHYPKDLPFMECEIKVMVSAAPEFHHRVRYYDMNFQDLQSKGLLTYSTEGTAAHGSYTPNFITFNGSLTDEGRKYVVGTRNERYTTYVKVKIGVLDFGEITGIVERKGLSIAEVSYTERAEDITPFGKFLNQHEQSYDRRVTFTRYDDGWRIDN